MSSIKNPEELSECSEVVDLVQKQTLTLLWDSSRTSFEMQSSMEAAQVAFARELGLEAFTSSMESVFKTRITSKILWELS